MQTKSLQKKRALRTALLVLLLSAVGMMKMYAYNFSAVCSTGQILYYNITNSTNHYVEVTYPANNVYFHWINYTMPTGALVIPNSVSYNGITYSVTSIGGGVFLYCQDLTSVTIPNSVTSIGDGAFNKCSGLTGRLVIPNSVTSIGNSAFLDCSSLTSVTISNSVTSIGRFAFSGCSGLTSVTIPNSVSSIGVGAFKGCSGLTGQLVIPNSVTSIGNEAFYGCSSLTGQLVIPNSVTSIGNEAFYGCSGLTSVTIPSSMTSIGEDAFCVCNSLTSVYYTGSIEQWCGICFGNNYSNPGRENLYIDNALVTDLVIPSSVTLIKGSAFSGFSCLTSVTIPNSVTSIGEFAFSGCSGLSSIEIPNSVTSIGDYAFYFCDNITSVYYTGSVEQWCGICFGNYRSNPCRENLYINNAFVTDLVIPSSVTSIGDYTFFHCKSLTSVTIPNSVTSIGVSAFEGCSGLTSVTIPNSVTSIGEFAFCYCSGLTSMTIPNSVTSIGAGVFDSCGRLTSVAIPNSVTSIGDYAFCDCYRLTSVTIPNSVTSIGAKAFYYCPDLTSVIIPNSVTSIGAKAFYRCSGLTNIIVLATEPPLLGDEVFEDVPILVIPCGSKHDYIVSDWANCFSTISEDCTQHSINIDNISSNGGSVSVSTSSANLGEEVRVTITPNQGMSLSSLIVCNASDPSQTVPVYPISKSISTYGFLMPPYDVAVKAVFVVGNAIGEGNNIAASVYPNPTMGRVNIEADDLKQVSISNILGQTIYESEASGNEFTYDFGQQKDGVYLIRIETASGVVTKRVVVTR